MRFLFPKDSRYSALLHIWGNRKVCAHKSFSPPSPLFFGAIELGTWVEVVPLLQVRPTLKPLDFDKTIMMTLNKNTIDCKVQIHSGNTQKWFNSCSGALLL